MPFAPGTFGSAAGFIFVFLLKPGDNALLLFSLCLFLTGWLTAHHAEKVLVKDSSHIVIDELCGYLISTVFLPRSTGYLFAAFILFRIFDIVKPPPVRNAEKRIPGGAGVMMDDILAGLYANICLQSWRYFYG